MSTEQKPAPTPPAPPAPAPAAPVAKHEPKAEPNALAQSLAGRWEKFKQGKLLSYPMMALILVVVAGVGVAIYISRSNSKTESALWVEWDAAMQGPVSGMDEFAEKHPNTPQGRTMAFQSAVIRLSLEGMDLFAAPNADVRKKAVESVEKARTAFIKLADDFKDDPTARVQCLHGAAKAEAALVGMPKDGQTLDPLNPKPIENRGDPKKAIELLDKVAEAAPDTDLGKEDKKLADALRNLNTQDQVIKIQAAAYTIEAPLLPGFNPKMPRDAAHGFPGGLGGLPPSFDGP